MIIPLSCVNAENDTLSNVEQSVSNENIIENQDFIDYTTNHEITKNLQDSVKEDYSQTHNINNSEELSDILNTAEDLTGKHVIELNTKELIINKDFYIFNDDLELTFNGNGNQLTLQDNLAFGVKNVIFNNLIIEFDDNSQSNGGIDNYGNMQLNNVTIKDTKDYNKMVSLFKENAYYDFDDYDGVSKTFSYSTRQMNLNNKGVLYVNNSHFINNSGHSGASIYNDGKIIVENTVFEDSLGEFGIIHSNNDTVIKNCEFKNNRVLQQLILTYDNSELINITFSNNIIAGSSILDNRGYINIKDCKFTNNTAKYDLIDNWVYMDTSNLNLCNNTCEELINSFGNLTLKDSFIKDNTCSRAIIVRDTIYHDTTTHEIDKAGNVTLIGNKIFRGNVEYTDFFNNPDTGMLSLFNNTIYDKPDYEGDCIFEGNTFIGDKNLYDDEGNYHGQRRELEISHNTNYEIVADEYQGTVISLEPIAETYEVGESIIISGTLTDINNYPLSNKNIEININGGEPDFGFYNLDYNTTTDENGMYYYEYTLKNEGPLNITVYFRNDTSYGFSYNKTSSYVTVLDNSTEEYDNISDINESINNETNTNQSDDEKNIDNSTNPYKVTPRNNNKTHKQIITPKKPYNIIKNKKLPDIKLLKVDTSVTLSWLNDLFEYDFKNKNLLIYIDDILVFNGTTSDDPSEILFKVLEEYSGEHSLKVIADNNTYQKLVNII